MSDVEKQQRIEEAMRDLAGAIGHVIKIVGNALMNLLGFAHNVNNIQC
jgi:hypothetical protein